MNGKACLFVLFVGLLVLGSVGPSLATSDRAPRGGPSIDWWVIGGGGGSLSSNGISIDFTIGQPVVGSDVSGNILIAPGYWGGGWDADYEIYLPVVYRNAH